MWFAVSLRPLAREQVGRVLSPAGRAGNAVRTCFRYTQGWTPFRFTEAAMLKSTVEGVNPPSPPRCSQLRRPTQSGRIACSAGALSIVSRPSVRYTPRARLWFEA